MTAEEIGKLTIAEVEAIAERAGQALAAFHEARVMLAGPSAPLAATPPQRPSAMPPASVQWTPGELAERERFKRLNSPAELPSDIAKAMEAE